MRFAVLSLLGIVCINSSVAIAQEADDNQGGELEPILTPLEQEIVDLREQKAELSKRINELRGQQELMKVFDKKVARLTERYQLEEAAVAKLNLAAKGVVIRTLRKADKLKWTEDLPDWVDGWESEYLHRDGEHVYFGASPLVYYASSSNVWRDAVRSVLSDEQLQKRQADSENRRNFRTQVAAASCTVEMDQELKLSPQQREEVQQVFIEFIEDSGIHSDPDLLLFLTQSRADKELPRDKLQEVLEPKQYEKWERKQDR